MDRNNRGIGPPRMGSAVRTQHQRGKRSNEVRPVQWAMTTIALIVALYFVITRAVRLAGFLFRVVLALVLTALLLGVRWG